jgi:hypothetical protein
MVKRKLIKWLGPTPRRHVDEGIHGDELEHQSDQTPEAGSELTGHHIVTGLFFLTIFAYVIAGVSFFAFRRLPFIEWAISITIRPLLPLVCVSFEWLFQAYLASFKVSKPWYIIYSVASSIYCFAASIYLVYFPQNLSTRGYILAIMLLLPVSYFARCAPFWAYSGWKKRRGRVGDITLDHTTTTPTSRTIG